MPSNIIPAQPSQVMPLALCSAYQEELRIESLVNRYSDGSSDRAALVLFTRPSHLSRIDVDGAGNEESITESTNRRLMVSDWSRDGRLVMYTELAPDTG